VELAPLSSVLLQLLVTLLCLWLGLIFLGLTILTLSFSLGVRATFSMLLLRWVCRTEILLILLLNLDIISISGSQRGDVQKLYICLDVPMYTIVVLQNQVFLRVFNTHICVQGMEDVGVLRHHLVSLLVWSCPSHVLVIIVSNIVVFLLEGINKSCPSGSWPKNCKLISHMFLTVCIPPISDMGSAKVIFSLLEKIWTEK
jgi:hypothetical protein